MSTLSTVSSLFKYIGCLLLVCCLPGAHAAYQGMPQPADLLSEGMERWSPERAHNNPYVGSVPYEQLVKLIGLLSPPLQSEMIRKLCTAIVEDSDALRAEACATLFCTIFPQLSVPQRIEAAVQLCRLCQGGLEKRYRFRRVHDILHLVLVYLPKAHRIEVASILWKYGRATDRAIHRAIAEVYMAFLREMLRKVGIGIIVGELVLVVMLIPNILLSAFIWSLGEIAPRLSRPLYSCVLALLRYTSRINDQIVHDTISQTFLKLHPLLSIAQLRSMDQFWRTQALHGRYVATQTGAWYLLARSALRDEENYDTIIQFIADHADHASLNIKQCARNTISFLATRAALDDDHRLRLANALCNKMAGAANRQECLELSQLFSTDILPSLNDFNQASLSLWDLVAGNRALEPPCYTLAVSLIPDLFPNLKIRQEEENVRLLTGLGEEGLLPVGEGNTRWDEDVLPTDFDENLKALICEYANPFSYDGILYCMVKVAQNPLADIHLEGCRGLAAIIRAPLSLPQKEKYAMLDAFKNHLYAPSTAAVHAYICEHLAKLLCSWHELVDRNSPMKCAILQGFKDALFRSIPAKNTGAADPLPAAALRALKSLNVSYRQELARLLIGEDTQTSIPSLEEIIRKEREEQKKSLQRLQSERKSQPKEPREVLQETESDMRVLVQLQINDDLSRENKEPVLQYETELATEIVMQLAADEPREEKKHDEVQQGSMMAVQKWKSIRELVGQLEEDEQDEEKKDEELLQETESDTQPFGQLQSNVDLSSEPQEADSRQPNEEWEEPTRRPLHSYEANVHEFYKTLTPAAFARFTKDVAWYRNYYQMPAPTPEIYIFSLADLSQPVMSTTNDVGSAVSFRELGGALD